MHTSPAQTGASLRRHILHHHNRPSGAVRREGSMYPVRVVRFLYVLAVGAARHGVVGVALTGRMVAVGLA